MKKLFAFLLACVCALALFGCAGANDDKSDGGPEDDTTPLTVIYALSDFLIMILSWLVKQSLRAFLFQEVQP